MLEKASGAFGQGIVAPVPGLRCPVLALRGVGKKGKVWWPNNAPAVLRISLAGLGNTPLRTASGRGEREE
jgi:hypothetical protein